MPKKNCQSKWTLDRTASPPTSDAPNLRDGLARTAYSPARIRIAVDLPEPPLLLAAAMTAAL